MRESTLKNFTNPDPMMNSSYASTLALTMKLAQTPWWKRIQYGYQRPERVDGFLEPVDATKLDPADPIDMREFGPNGTLNQSMLNNHVALVYPDMERPVVFNVGYLVQYFIVGEAAGFAEITRVVDAVRQHSVQQLVAVE